MKNEVKQGAIKQWEEILDDIKNKVTPRYFYGGNRKPKGFCEISFKNNGGPTFHKSGCLGCVMNKKINNKLVCYNQHDYIKSISNYVDDIDIYVINKQWDKAEKNALIVLDAIRGI